MGRNRRFDQGREPFRHDASLVLQRDKILGPLDLFNPTQAKFQPTPASVVNQRGPQDIQEFLESSNGPDRQLSPTVQYEWTSRNNRKGRHAVTILPHPPVLQEAEYVLQSIMRWRSVAHTLWLMMTYYPIWDISWCIAYIFTWGSAIWILNGLFVFLPFVQPSWTFYNQVLLGGGISAFIGATVFQVGGILLLLEAVNENRDGCFGWAVEQVYEERLGQSGSHNLSRFIPDLEGCRHHHQNKKSFLGAPHDTHDTPSSLEVEDKIKDLKRTWSWCPSWHELKTHYFHELGFIASVSEFVGTTIFWIGGLTALPGINSRLSTGALYGIYWFPLLLGGVLFVFSGWLFMIETQKHWWKPAPTTLAWHIGFWNFLGGIAFFLSPAFGYSSQHWAQYQACLISLWGSCAFLIGSSLQWYESLDKSPVGKSM